MEGAREYLEIPMRHTTAHNHDAQAQHRPTLAREIKRYHDPSEARQ